MTANERLGDAIELFRGDVRLDVAAHQRQRLGDDPAGRGHRFDLARRFDRDHRPMIRLMSSLIWSTVPVPGTRCTIPRCE